MQDVRDRYFDDWHEGEVFETDSHLMTEERIRSFAEEFDPQPFHVDPAAATASIYGGIIASGWHTGSVMMRLLTSLLGEASMGAPGLTNLRWSVPVRPGDRVRLRMTVLEVRASASKPDRGLLRSRNDLLNQHDEVVMSTEPTMFFKRRL